MLMQNFIQKTFFSSIIVLSLTACGSSDRGEHFHNWVLSGTSNSPDPDSDNKPPPQTPDETNQSTDDVDETDSISEDIVSEPPPPRDNEDVVQNQPDPPSNNPPPQIDNTKKGFLPFDPYERRKLTASKKKVFAHYFTPYPLSINNKEPDKEYYNVNYLSASGEQGKFKSSGGLLRQKPLDRAPVPNHEPYETTDYRQEIRLADSLGIDGFAINILSSSGTHWERTLKLLDLSIEESENFKILLMPDMVSLGSSSNFVSMIETLSKKPAAYRLDDGRLLIAPYLAERKPPQWWASQISQLEKKGINIALMPVFQGWQSGLNKFIQAFPNEYKNMLYGVSDWGPRTPTGARTIQKMPKQVHQYGLKWMSPVAPQDARPKSLIYTEAGNSETFRTLWESAIQGGADMAQIITWNDYSESSEIAPSTRTQYAFYDLTSYYVNWFKTGKQPTVKRDVMYAFYRNQKSTTPLTTASPQSNTMNSVNGETPRDDIELLAFLTKPALLEIEIAGQIYQKEAQAGMNSFKTKLKTGTPIFRIIRNNKTIEEMEGLWGISNAPVDAQNMIYHGMSSLRLQPKENKLAVSWPWRYGAYSNSRRLSISDEDSIFSRKTNLLPIKYSDKTCSTKSGIGFSFLPPKADASTTLSFDFMVKGSSSRQFEYAVKSIDKSGQIGSELIIGSDNGLNIKLINRTASGDAFFNKVMLKSDRWYRIDMKMNSIGNRQQDNYNITITHPDQSQETISGLPFHNNLDSINGLTFSCVDNSQVSESIIVDNVAVSSQ